VQQITVSAGLQAGGEAERRRRWQVHHRAGGRSAYKKRGLEPG
jgi:hypothetical protein